MTKHTIAFILALFASTYLSSEVQAQLMPVRLATYNLELFTDNEDSVRTEALRLVLEELDASLMVIQGVKDLNAMFAIAGTSNGVLPSLSPTGNFSSNQQTYNVVLFDITQFEIVAPNRINLPDRDAIAVTFRHLQSNDTLTLVSVELTQGDDSPTIIRRLQQVQSLDSALTALGLANQKVIVAGALYAASHQDPAIVILEKGELQLTDPTEVEGLWSNSKEYAVLHTTSTDTAGGAPGLTRRDDFILVSRYFETSAPLAFGNDGEHFGKSVDAENNLFVSGEIASALRIASTHLPVITEFALGISSTHDIRSTAPQLLMLE